MNPKRKDHKNINNNENITIRAIVLLEEIKVMAGKMINIIVVILKFAQYKTGKIKERKTRDVPRSGSINIRNHGIPTIITDITNTFMLLMGSFVSERYLDKARRTAIFANSEG